MEGMIKNVVAPKWKKIRINNTKVEKLLRILRNFRLTTLDEVFCVSIELKFLLFKMFIAVLTTLALSYDCSNCQSYTKDIYSKLQSGMSKDDVVEYYEKKFQPLPKPLRPNYIKDLIEVIDDYVEDHKAVFPIVVCVQIKQCSIFNSVLKNKGARKQVKPLRPAN